MSVKIVVCVKQVPDSWSEKHLDPASSTLDRANVDRVLNDLDEYAVEEAVTLAEQTGGEVTVISMGPESASEAIVKTLQMGADHGILVTDPELAGSDAIATSAVLAAAITRCSPDLVIFGIESTDAKMSVIPSMVAERLAMVQLTAAQKVHLEASEKKVTIERRTSMGYDIVSASLPVVISVVEALNEPRYPSMKSIMAARKKSIEHIDLNTLGLAPASVGSLGAWSQVASFSARPPKAKGEVVADDGSGASRIVEFLSEQKLI